MYRAYENTQANYYVSWEDDTGTHSQPSVWTTENQYTTLAAARKVAQRRNSRYQAFRAAGLDEYEARARL